MNDLKRYENLSQVHGTMQEHPHGAWVRHADAMTAIEQARQEERKRWWRALRNAGITIADGGQYRMDIESGAYHAIQRAIREERKRQAQVGDDAASEMNGIIREITISINGDDEPAFLDDAVRRAIANAVAIERWEIQNQIHAMIQQKGEEATNSDDYEEHSSLVGEMEAYTEVYEMVKQRDPTKQPVRRKDDEDE